MDANRLNRELAEKMTYCANSRTCMVASSKDDSSCVCASDDVARKARDELV